MAGVDFHNMSIKKHRQKVAEWTVAAWNAVSADNIKKGFKQNGISVALDGSEEHLVHIT